VVDRDEVSLEVNGRSRDQCGRKYLEAGRDYQPAAAGVVAVTVAGVAQSA
jgi:hypothetical protein